MSPVDWVRAALQLLPAECRYHGDKVTAVERWGQPDARYDGACCETGMRSLARRRGLDALATLARAWETRPTVSDPQIAAQPVTSEPSPIARLAVWPCPDCGSPYPWMNPLSYTVWIFVGDGERVLAGTRCTNSFHHDPDIPKD